MNMTSSGLQCEVAYWPAMTLGGAAQVAAAHCPNERTLDPAVSFVSYVYTVAFLDNCNALLCGISCQFSAVGYTENLQLQPTVTKLTSTQYCTDYTVWLNHASQQTGNCPPLLICQQIDFLAGNFLRKSICRDGIFSLKTCLDWAVQSCNWVHFEVQFLYGDRCNVWVTFSTHASWKFKLKVLNTFKF